MVERLSNYALSLISSIFILNIVQMLLPENKNQKYILFVSSMIVTIILIEPIINIVNKDISVANVLMSNQEEMIELSEENYKKYYEVEVLNQYKSNIEAGIIERLESMGYKTQVIKCEYNQETLEPEYLYLELLQSDGEITPVKIEVANTPQKDDLTLMQKLQITEVLRKEYGIDKMEVVKWKN